MYVKVSEFQLLGNLSARPPVITYPEFPMAEILKQGSMFRVSNSEFGSRKTPM
jgi:hypothetical protein